MLTASRGLAPYLQLVPSGVKISTNEWLNMMEGAVIGCRAWARLGAHHGQRALSQGKGGARVVRSHIARARPRSVQLSRLATHAQDTPNDAHAPNPTLFTTPRRHRPPDDSPYMNLLVTWERDHTGDVYSSLPYLAQGGGGAGLGCCAFLAAPGRLLRD